MSKRPVVSYVNVKIVLHAQAGGVGYSNTQYAKFVKDNIYIRGIKLSNY